MRRHAHPTRDSGRLAILFDFGGTLDAEGVAWKERFFRLWCEEVGEIRPECFDPAFHTADDALVGVLPPTLSLQHTVEKVTINLGRGLAVSDPAILNRIATRFVNEAWERLSINAVLLGELSRRYRLGVVSNFYGNLGAICREVGLSRFLSVVVESACVGYAKPAPQIFSMALTALNAEPRQALFIGDSFHRDMIGARNLGMPHVWLTPGSSGHGSACCPDDPVIHRLDELRGLL